MPGNATMRKTCELPPETETWPATSCFSLITCAMDRPVRLHIERLRSRAKAGGHTSRAGSWRAGWGGSSVVSGIPPEPEEQGGQGLPAGSRDGKKQSRCEDARVRGARIVFSRWGASERTRARMAQSGSPSLAPESTRAPVTTREPNDESVEKGLLFTTLLTV